MPGRAASSCPCSARPMRSWLATTSTHGMVTVPPRRRRHSPPVLMVSTRWPPGGTRRQPVPGYGPDRCGRAVGHRRPSAAAPATGAGRHRRRGAAPRRARRGLFRHRVPRRPVRGSRHLCAANGLAGTFRPAPLWVSRTLPRSRVAMRGRACRSFSRTAPHGALPPGSWRLFPSGRPVDTTTGFTPLEGPATCAMSRPPRAAVITTSGRRSVSTCTGCAARSPPWAGRTFWCSPAGSVSRSRRACRCRHRAGFPRRRHRRRQQQRRAWRRARPARSGSCLGPARGHVLHSRLLRLADQYPGELQSPTREFHGCDQPGRARSWKPGPAQLAAAQATDTRN